MRLGHMPWALMKKKKQKCSLLSRVSVTELIIPVKNAFCWSFLSRNMRISIHTGISGGGL